MFSIAQAAKSNTASIATMMSFFSSYIITLLYYNVIYSNAYDDVTIHYKYTYGRVTITQNSWGIKINLYFQFAL